MNDLGSGFQPLKFEFMSSLALFLLRGAYEYQNSDEEVLAENRKNVFQLRSLYSGFLSGFVRDN